MFFLEYEIESFAQEIGVTYEFIYKRVYATDPKTEEEVKKCFEEVKVKYSQYLGIN